MGLTWDEFLKLATIITKLDDSIEYFESKTSVKEKNRRVTEAAKEYLKFFNDLKYVQFMNEVRKSLTYVIISVRYKNIYMRNYIFVGCICLL